MFRLDNRVALVTGGTRGLGKEICLALARAGAKVAMNFCHDRGRAELALADLRSLGGDCLLVQGDVTDAASVDRVFAECEASLGPVDVLVVNATCDQPQLSIEEYDWAFHQTMLDFFVKSPVLLAKRCLPHMKRQRWGRIVHVTSEVVALAAAPFSAYVAAKGGQTGLALSTARELAPAGVTVNMVAPGWIPVERHAGCDAAALENYRRGVPVGRMGTPADVAPAVVYFCSEEAQFVTGQVLAVNGGNTLGRPS
jgi:3-oxoacyl-[acyl-carrier protein] reductase